MSAARSAYFGILLIGLFLSAGDAWGDWINLTGAESAPNIAEIFVGEDGVRVGLELSLAELERLPEADEDVARLAMESLTVHTDQGTQLPVNLMRAERRPRKPRAPPLKGAINPTTGQPVREQAEQSDVLFLDLEYPFAERPAALIFSPPLDESGRARLTLGFIVTHRAVPVIDFRYLSAPARLTLDWNDPWYSAFDQSNLTRQFNDPLMSFLYLEPREVRHEILVRLRDLGRWMDLGLGGEALIPAGAQTQFLERVAAFFAARNPLRIEGQARSPEIARAQFVTLSRSGLQLLEGDRTLDPDTAMIGVILRYAVERIPQEVEVEWQLFDEQATRVPATMIDPAGPFVMDVGPGDPVIQWRNVLRDDPEPVIIAVPLGPEQLFRLPLISLGFLAVALVAAGLALRPRVLARRTSIGIGLVGLLLAVLALPFAGIHLRSPFAGAPAPATLTQIVVNLHGALRETVDLRRRDALAVSVAPEHLEDLEAEAQRGLAIEVLGGGSAAVDRVDGVEIKEASALPGGGFRVRAAWRADASAGHWGHRHRRQMVFEALFDLMPIEGTWKLTGLTVLRAQPVDQV
ncbi:MAG: hypothetical protein AAF495_00350 [Pseudomonadota bacterium]